MITEQQKRAMIEMKAAVSKLDSDPYLAVALLIGALRDFLFLVVPHPARKARRPLPKGRGIEGEELRRQEHRC